MKDHTVLIAFLPFRVQVSCREIVNHKGLMSQTATSLGEVKAGEKGEFTLPELKEGNVGFDIVIYWPDFDTYFSRHALVSDFSEEA